jgi:hypothetical protein
MPSPCAADYSHSGAKAVSAEIYERFRQNQPDPGSFASIPQAAFPWTKNLFVGTGLPDEMCSCLPSLR